MTEENKTPEEAAENAEATVETKAEQEAEKEAEQPELTVESLQAENVVLLNRVEMAEKKAQEATLRAHAEVENLRKRLERDTDNARKYALEKFANELLTVADSLERGLAALDEENEALKPARDGLSLTRKQFVDVLQKFAVEEVDPQGQPFNAELHEVISMLPSDEASNTVLQVMQKGYTLNGRLLRPAMVVVAQ